MERAFDVPSIEHCLLELAGLFGFDWVCGGILPVTGMSPDEVSARIFIACGHAEWVRRYVERGYVFRDPIVAHLAKVRSAFTWEEAYAHCKRIEDVRLIRGEAEAFGLRCGIVVPVPTLDDNLAAISFGGADGDMSESAKAALSFAASYAVGRLLRVGPNRPASEAAITSREMDCLLWAAEGKSDWEIATILGISRSTVLKHMRSAREKLDAVNRTHAVVKAQRCRYIEVASARAHRRQGRQ
jgi:LuxR family quorum sensing-dependent transcriptional regulator